MEDLSQLLCMGYCKFLPICFDKHGMELIAVVCYWSQWPNDLKKRLLQSKIFYNTLQQNCTGLQLRLAQVITAHCLNLKVNRSSAVTLGYLFSNWELGHLTSSLPK